MTVGSYVTPASAEFTAAGEMPCVTAVRFRRVSQASKPAASSPQSAALATGATASSAAATARPAHTLERTLIRLVIAAATPRVSLPGAAVPPPHLWHTRRK